MAAGVDDDSVVSRFEGSDGAIPVAFVTPFYFPHKEREVTIYSLCYQLFMAPPGTLLDARGEKYFDRRIGKHHRAHVASVRHQPRRTAKSPLTTDERLAHFRVGGDHRSVVSAAFAAHSVIHVPAAKEHPGGLILGSGLETGVEPSGHTGHRSSVAQIDAGFASGKGRETVEGAAVQVMEAGSERSRQDPFFSSSPRRIFSGVTGSSVILTPTAS